MQLQVSRHSSISLSHDKKQKLLVAEASDLGLTAFHCLYDDACDVGLELINPKTGNVTRWALSNTDTDKEGDTLAWELVPTPETIRKNPELNGYKFTILND